MASEEIDKTASRIVIPTTSHNSSIVHSRVLGSISIYLVCELLENRKGRIVEQDRPSRRGGSKGGGFLYYCGNDRCGGSGGGGGGGSDDGGCC